MGDKQRYPNLALYFKSLKLDRTAASFRNLRRRWYVLVFAAFLGVVSGLTHSTPYRIFLLVFLAVGFLFMEAYLNRKKSNFRDKMPLMLPLVLERAMNKNQLDNLLGSDISLRLDHLAALARQCKVHLAEAHVLGQKQPAMYRSTIRESIDAVNGIFRSAVWSVRNPLIYRTAVTAENLKDFSVQEGKMAALEKEASNFSRSLVGPSPEQDITLILERLKVMSEFEKSLKEDANPTVQQRLSE